MRSFLPTLSLTIVVAILALLIGRFAPLSAGTRVASPGTGYDTPAIRTGSLHYPRQSIDSDSYVVKIAQPVRRIVSQDWSIDEYVYSVVPAERVIAVSSAAYDRTFSNVYQLAEKYHPAIATDPEKVLWLNPDLLIVSDSSRADFCDLVRAANVPIFRAFTMFISLQQVADTIRLTGYLTGEDASARRESDLFWNEIRRAQSLRPSHAPHPRVLGFSGTYSYGSGTLFDDIVRTLGGINVGAQGGLKGYDEVNSEQIVRWNPEWIISGANKGQTKTVLARLLSDPAIKLTTAARNGHIVVFENSVFLPMSPFTRFFVTALSKVLYG